MVSGIRLDIRESYACIRPKNYPDREFQILGEMGSPFVYLMISFKVLEDIDRIYDEMERDPVKKQVHLFNEYAVQCFGEARKNQTKTTMEETEAACW